MKFDGTFSAEISDFGTFEVKDGKTTGIIHVPKKWIKAKTIILFLKDGEIK
jgi:hypothetical protein